MTLSRLDPPVVSTSETITAYRNWADAGAVVESDGTGGKALSQIGMLFSDSPRAGTVHIRCGRLQYELYPLRAR